MTAINPAISVKVMYIISTFLSDSNRSGSAFMFRTYASWSQFQK